MSQNVFRSPVFCALALAFLLFSASRVLAHGTYPGATRIAFDPERPGRVLAATNLGLMLTEDGGASWKWSCIASYGAYTTDDPVFALGKSNAIVVGHSSGLVASSDACAFSPPDQGVDGAPVSEVAYDPVANRFWSIASRSSFSAAYVSDDSGQSWQVALQMPAGVFLRSLRLSPGDGKVVYLSATRATASNAASTGGEALVYRSKDGGSTWESFPYRLNGTEYDLYLLGVDPENPERLFGRTSAQAVERILLSEDGGQSFRAVHSAEGPFLGFAIGGGRAYVGSDRSGLFRSEDNGLTFQLLNAELPVHCLAVHGGQLYMCPGYARASYEIGVSDDHGQTFKPVLEFKQFTGEVVCGAGSQLDLLCAEELPLARSTLELLEAMRDPTAFSPGPAPDPEPVTQEPVASEQDAGVDAVASEPAAARDIRPPGSCGVNGATEPRASNYMLLWLALMVSSSMAWRRRKAAERECSSKEGNEHA